MMNFLQVWLGRVMAPLALAVSVWCISLVITPSALALTPIKVTNPSYAACPAEMAAGVVTTRNSQPAKCFIISATAQNNSGKPVYDADVFGRIYDANGDTIFENRGRIGTVAEIPPGKSQIQVRITVEANQPEPLQLKQLKATGFSGQIRTRQIIPDTAE